MASIFAIMTWTLCGTKIGAIFQDFMRYDMTAAENIGMGRIEAANNIFQIRAAAMKSYAENLIRKLPESVTTSSWGAGSKAVWNSPAVNGKK